jgi:hypothetical protein
LPIEENGAGLLEDKSSLIQCPSDPAPGVVAGVGIAKQLKSSYGHNYCNMEGGAIKITRVVKPTSFIMITDSGSAAQGNNPALISPWGTGWPVASWHHGFCNVLWGDFSISRRSYNDITYFQNGIPSYWNWK